MVLEVQPPSLSDEHLLELVDLPALWTGLNGPTRSLRAALLGAAKISANGRTPFKLTQPDRNVEIDHPQMMRLWQRLEMIPVKATV
jgi:hypothetical protein